ncbi:YXWGXW repeat-containing protein [Paracidovorax sp. MALMAid1276]|uniref:YXWGXW repeat-containing protein n=1 Tax=Paracidovorax sp. MALMAid1276 TaxID=3411631 RepID=UPI003B9CAF81
MARNALAAVSIALLSLGAATVAQAQTSATVVIQAGGPHYRAPAPVHEVQYHRAPPPPRHEAVPHPRRGMVWVPGHWEWRGHRHVWTQGHWVKARPGYHYREPRWVEHGGRWDMRPGGWDRDGDGVPNRHDRRPNNPYRY